MSRSILVAASLALAGTVHASSPWNFVVIPDTQFYSNDDTRALQFNQQTQWIVDNRVSQNIQFVAHLGDVTQDATAAEWQRARTAMDILHNVPELPYSTVPGNHDYAITGNKFSGASQYVENFGPQRYTDRPWYGGASPNGQNSYHFFTANGRQFLHLGLEWQPNRVVGESNSSIAWARSILEQYPNTPTILSTHELITDSASVANGRSTAGQFIWDYLVDSYDQIFMTVNGHFHAGVNGDDGERLEVANNSAGRPVFQLLTDYQAYPNGGDGYLRLYTFDEANNQIHATTYSPKTDATNTAGAGLSRFQLAEQMPYDMPAGLPDINSGTFQIDANSRFSLNVDFASRFLPVQGSDPLPLPEPPAPPAAGDYSFRDGVNGYVGTQDTMVRSNETATGSGQTSPGDSRNRSFGELIFMSVDGDDGSPGLKPNQGLVRFDNVVGTDPGQIPAGTPIREARLILEVFDQGSGFTVHDMLVDWSESSTWNTLGNGVQVDGIEAALDILASLGADNGSGNVQPGTLIIDVTDSVRGYLDGSLNNLGWLLNPFANGTNGIDIHTSETTEMSLRPRLDIFIPEPATLGVIAGAGLLALRRRSR